MSPSVLFFHLIWPVTQAANDLQDVSQSISVLDGENIGLA
jgi:hypothetical protein